MFCKLSPMQLGLYRAFNSSKEVSRLLSGSGSQPLKAIMMLKKLCNHPALLDRKDFSFDSTLFPPGFNPSECQPELSGKMQLLERMIGNMRFVPESYLLPRCCVRTLIMSVNSKTSNDKIVLISNYTQTLDLMDKLCRSRKWGVLRLDGSMTIQKRQKLVDRFNDLTQPEFIFLLSSKAGGCGINLVNFQEERCLVSSNALTEIVRLERIDWSCLIRTGTPRMTPRLWLESGAMDKRKLVSYTDSLQPDQLRRRSFKVTIYSFFLSFPRTYRTPFLTHNETLGQAHKQSLSSCVVDAEEDVERHFSLEALRQLFQLNENTLCDTHDTFKCKRCINGRQVVKPKEGTINTGATAADTSTWNHFSADDMFKVFDPVLREEALATKAVTFVFQNKVGVTV